MNTPPPAPSSPDQLGPSWRWGDESEGRSPRSLWRALSPAQLFVASFLVLIAAGTVGFQVLPGLYAGPSLGWIDSLFTATSAVCVTGLIVVDTATYLTIWGQAYVLLLIQLGGSASCPSPPSSSWYWGGACRCGTRRWRAGRLGPREM